MARYAKGCRRLKRLVRVRLKTARNVSHLYMDTNRAYATRVCGAANDLVARAEFLATLCADPVLAPRLQEEVANTWRLIDARCLKYGRPRLTGEMERAARRPSTSAWYVTPSKEERAQD